MGIYYWGACLEVTGPIRDIRQKVTQYSLETEVVAATVTARFPSLSRSSKKAFTGKTVNIPYINN